MSNYSIDKIICNDSCKSIKYAWSSVQHTDTYIHIYMYTHTHTRTHTTVLVPTYRDHI